MDTSNAGMSGIFTFQYLPREQLVSLLQKLQAENMHLRSQLTDCQERNRILQHTLPSMLQEFLTRTPKRPSDIPEWDHVGSTQIPTDIPQEVRHTLERTENDQYYDKKVTEFPLHKVQGTQTPEFLIKPSADETAPNSQTATLYPMSTLPLMQQQQQNGHHLNGTSVPNGVTVATSDNKTAVVYSPPVHSPVTSVNEADSGEDLAEASHVRSRLDPMRIDLNCPEFRRIEAMILSDPRITQSRDWTAYTQANEWTRATCSLMSALFTSGEMAQCTVLGRGIKEPRQRLPVDKALYIVAVISKRFVVSPTRVRARMAQKCKDERRKHRANNIKYAMPIQMDT